jgi:hypothetical protein
LRGFGVINLVIAITAGYGQDEVPPPDFVEITLHALRFTNAIIVAILQNF